MGVKMDSVLLDGWASQEWNIYALTWVKVQKFQNSELSKFQS